MAAATALPAPLLLPPHAHLLLLVLLLLRPGAADDALPLPRGCGAGLDPSYRLLCDLESVWGVVLEAVACVGGASALALAGVLLRRLRAVTEPERRSGAGPLLLLLLGVLGLFGLSLAFVMARGEAVCVARRAGWSWLFALCFSCLLAQALRLRRLAAGRRSPSGPALAALAFGAAAVQGVVGGEWVLLTVVREGRSACDYPPLDFALVCGYALLLLLTAAALALGVLLRGGPRGGDQDARKRRRRWSCNAVWLFLSCLGSLLVWAAWLGFYLYEDAAATAAGEGEEPALAIALVMEGWALLLFHAVPETHLCLRAGEREAEAGAGPGGRDHHEARWSAGAHACRRRDDDEPAANHRAAYPDRQAFSVEEHDPGMQVDGYHAAMMRSNPPFRSHVYQPTEMALLMNGGAIPSAPPNYTGRHLW